MTEQPKNAAALRKYTLRRCYMNSLTVCQYVLFSLKEKLGSDAFLEQFKNHKAFTRNRLLSMRQVVFFLLNASKRCMNIDISSIRWTLPSIRFPDVSKQAISKARKGINPKLFKSLFRHSCESYFRFKGSRESWNGYYPYAIDGSRIQVPKTKDNLSYFGSAANQKARTLPAMAAVSLLYDLKNDIILDVALNNFNYAERSSAKDHLDYIEGCGLWHNALIICDRGYPSYELYSRISEKGYYFLMRIQKNIPGLTKHVSGTCMDDVVTDYRPAYIRDGDTVRVRIIRIILESGEEEYLVTNLFDSSITPEMFRELYHMRWGVESKYLELKSRLELEEFTGACHTSVEQEFFITVMISNLSAMVKKDADREIERQCAVKRNRYAYQSNRSSIIGQMKEMLAPMMCGERDIGNILDQIYSSAVRRRSQIQPDRKCERPRIQLKRKHFNNRKTSM